MNVIIYFTTQSNLAVIYLLAVLRVLVHMSYQLYYNQLVGYQSIIKLAFNQIAWLLYLIEKCFRLLSPHCLPQIRLVNVVVFKHFLHHSNFKLAITAAFVKICTCSRFLCSGQSNVNSNRFYGRKILTRLPTMAPQKSCKTCLSYKVHLTEKSDFMTSLILK